MQQARWRFAYRADVLVKEIKNMKPIAYIYLNHYLSSY